ncbi:uncharacterized protein SOCG_04192 [Schizosaccharomyces octosporus yFS286]|uniref:Uncharacterized protein n=1 Tax=Schizosaccharomyces octosporus (strain yFS286) TaxID=483514 RepID=S9QWS1_SCHOY|nr:uncharacterized protein SOCG_04192 [Schizosaccharomyces octosporus yFS286]EPX70765.1 hypothetical protein SOCG_04192 [Schizosaccharomyces octosporus yFS286]
MAFEPDSAISAGNELEEHLNYLLYSPEKDVLKREHLVVGNYSEQGEPWAKKLKGEDSTAWPSDHTEHHVREVDIEEQDPKKSVSDVLNSSYKRGADEPLLSEVASSWYMRKTSETSSHTEKIEKAIADLLEGEDQETSLQQVAIQLATSKYEKYHVLFPEEALRDPSELCDLLKKVLVNSVQSSMESGSQPFFQLRQAINGNLIVSTIQTTPLYSQNILDSSPALHEEASILSNSVPVPESASLEGPFQWIRNNEQTKLNGFTAEEDDDLIENPLGVIEEESHTSENPNVNTNIKTDNDTIPFYAEDENWRNKFLAAYSGEDSLPSIEDIPPSSESLPPLFE